MWQQLFNVLVTTVAIKREPMLSYFVQSLILLKLLSLFYKEAVTFGQWHVVNFGLSKGGSHFLLSLRTVELDVD